MQRASAWSRQLSIDIGKRNGRVAAEALALPFCRLQEFLDDFNPFLLEPHFFYVVAMSCKSLENI